jgi:cytoskeletal protein RodZ
LVGEILKKKREELGMDLREISNSLKIRYDYLKAIEDGNIERLPADVYVKGYIHEYARTLDVDPEFAVKAYKEQLSASLNEKIIPPEKINTDRRPSRTRYFIVPALLLSFAIIVVTFVRSPDKPIFSGSASPTDRRTQPALTTPQPTIKERRDSPSAFLHPADEKEKQKRGDHVTDKPLASAGSKPETQQQVLEVFAVDTTWLFVTSDNADSREILMKPGESAKWYAKKYFFLKIGNAGGIRLVFNGKEIRNLGEKGQVIKINLPDAKI